MIIHGIGNLADGKEFWNTRTDGSPYEYTLGVDSVIRGFSEGMRHVREGDRIIITMKPELGYGARERTGIPANSTLTFDYEILAVKPLSFAKLMRDAIAPNRLHPTRFPGPSPDNPASVSLLVFDNDVFVATDLLIRGDLYRGQTCRALDGPYSFIGRINDYECPPEPAN